jgi:hypothetical protein
MLRAGAQDKDFLLGDDDFDPPTITFIMVMVRWDRGLHRLHL